VLNNQNISLCENYGANAKGSHYGHYAFDPKRTAILLIGGDKTGDDRFYDIMVPLADRIYDNYLNEIEEENNG